MDPIINCVIGACCPPETRAKALAKYLVSEGVDADQAERVSAVIVKAFDLAPAGTLTPLIAEVARLARGEAYKG